MTFIRVNAFWPCCNSLHAWRSSKQINTVCQRRVSQVSIKWRYAFSSIAPARTHTSHLMSKVLTLTSMKVQFSSKVDLATLCSKKSTIITAITGADGAITSTGIANSVGCQGIRSTVVSEAVAQCILYNWRRRTAGVKWCAIAVRRLTAWWSRKADFGGRFIDETARTVTAWAR